MFEERQKEVESLSIGSPAVRLIEPAQVIRDENGMFQHPELPNFDEGDGEKCKQ